MELNEARLEEIRKEINAWVIQEICSESTSKHR